MPHVRDLTSGNQSDARDHAGGNRHSPWTALFRWTVSLARVELCFVEALVSVTQLTPEGGHRVPLAVPMVSTGSVLDLDRATAKVGNGSVKAPWAP